MTGDTLGFHHVSPVVRFPGRVFTFIRLMQNVWDSRIRVRKRSESYRPL